MLITDSLVHISTCHSDCERVTNFVIYRCVDAVSDKAIFSFPFSDKSSVSNDVFIAKNLNFRYRIEHVLVSDLKALCKDGLSSEVTCELKMLMIEWALVLFDL